MVCQPQLRHQSPGRIHVVHLHSLGLKCSTVSMMRMAVISLKPRMTSNLSEDQTRYVCVPLGAETGNPEAPNIHLIFKTVKVG